MYRNGIIKEDLYRYGGLTGIKGLLKGLTIPGFRYMYILRKAGKYKRKSAAGLIYRFILRHYSIKYGIQIPIGTKIGKGFYIGHFGTIVVNINSLIGRNCNIAHNVTIGMANRGTRKGAPVLGDNIWIGTGSVIVGKVNIGDNVLIAPLSYVNFDIPANSIVLGNPARVIERSNATEGYINWVLDKYND